MSYELKIEVHNGYVHAVVSGENSASNVQGYLSDILEACKKRKVYRALIEENLRGPRLDVDQVFSVASEGAMAALGFFHAVAYVDPDMGEMAYFAETVSMNRGMPIRAFSNVEEARDWLLAQVEGDDEKNIFDGNR